MIIDSITHITPDGRWFNTRFDASEDRLMREIESTGISRVVVVPLAGYISNDFVLERSLKRADCLIPGASFNPAAHSNPSEAARELRSQIGGSPFRILKLHPRLNRYDPLDPRCLAVLEELSTWKSPLPVWLDSLFYYQGGVLRKPVVDTIHQLVGQFPGLEFVILHAAGSWALQVAEAIRDCPNAFLDVSFTLTRYEGSTVWQDLRYLLNTFDQRMVFGSDFPEIGLGKALDCFQLLSDGVSAQKRENVLGKNLHSILDRRRP